MTIGNRDDDDLGRDYGWRGQIFTGGGSACGMAATPNWAQGDLALGSYFFCADLDKGYPVGFSQR